MPFCSTYVKRMKQNCKIVYPKKKILIHYCTHISPKIQDIVCLNVQTLTIWVSNQRTTLIHIKSEHRECFILRFLNYKNLSFLTLTLKFLCKLFCCVFYIFLFIFIFAEQNLNRVAVFKLQFNFLFFFASKYNCSLFLYVQLIKIKQINTQ